MDIRIYDTTLRDGAQRHGISLSLEDKLKIARLLDGLGVRWIEGGWPGSNPKDAEFFRRAPGLGLRTARVTAFGSTRRAGVLAEEDANLKALLEAGTAAVALVGKSWPLHVTRVLDTTLDENLRMIGDSVALLKGAGREVIYDAEHFFDGHRADPGYALACLRAAAAAGADWLVLCDTNGGSFPGEVARVVESVRAALCTPLGIHTHNDGELAVANALAAVAAGATQVQGTINGYGERCGNANLISLIANLQLKLGHRCVADEQLAHLTELSRTVAEIANINPDAHAPFVGASAFSHKGGIHVAAVQKLTASYEHVPPERVGNRRHIVVSELSGRGNVRARAAELGLLSAGRDQAVLDRIKELERRGFQLEAAEGTFELLVRRAEPGYAPPFEVLDVVVVSEWRTRYGRGGLAAGGAGEAGMLVEATVKVRVGREILHTAADGDGPVQAVDRALRKALVPCFPSLAAVRLCDFKVRILDPESATAALTRVLIEATTEGGEEAGEPRSWTTVGCSANIIEASCQALTDSFELYLLRRARALGIAVRGSSGSPG